LWLTDPDPGGPKTYGFEKSGIFCDNFRLFDMSTSVADP
jgi:hypothetical protein